LIFFLELAFDGSVEHPTRWRVENSWGDKNNKGYGVMTDRWFDEFVYQIVVDRNILSESHQVDLAKSPVRKIPILCIILNICIDCSSCMGSNGFSSHLRINFP
jgi:hypothetical protein